MRKWFQAAAILSASTLLIAATGFLLLVRAPDPAPERVDIALQTALGRIHIARASMDAADPFPLEAGWALRDCTSSEPLPLAGYGARRGAQSEGASSPLVCRALALRAGDRTVILVSLDLLLIPLHFGRDLRSAFHDRTGLPPEALFLAPSHTHSAPDPWNHRLAALVTGGGYQAAYGVRLREAVLDAAEEAIARLAPAEWAVGRDWAPGYVRNRVRTKPLDAWIEWLAVRTIGGDSMALVVNYAAHGTVLGSSHRKADADYPGHLASALEALPSVDLALFQTGAPGSAAPRPPHVDGGGSPEARARALGQALAAEVSVMRTPPEWKRDAKLGAALVDIPLPPVQVRLGMTGRVLARWVSIRAGFEPEAPVHLIRIGHAAMIGLPVELSAEISLDLKDALFTGHGVNLWIASMSTGYYGYLTPDELYGARDNRGRPFYEASAMAFLGPHAERFFREVIHAAAAQ